MLQVTDDLIRNVVQEVLGHMKGKPIVATSPHPTSPPQGGREHGWGVFDNVDDAVKAAVKAQKQLEALGLDARKKATDCIREICIEQATPLGQEEFDETRIG